MLYSPYTILMVQISDYNPVAATLTVKLVSFASLTKRPEENNLEEEKFIMARCQKFSPQAADSTSLGLR